MTQFELNTPDVMSEDFDADLVLLNLRSGEYFNITGAARAFLDAILQGIGPDSLAALLGRENPQAGAEAAEYFANLQKHKLLRPKPDSTALEAQPDHVAGILALGTAFPFECFDDLSALLAADPIHDVTPEAGWPVMPDAG